LKDLSIDGRISGRMDLEEIGQEPMTDACEHGTEFWFHKRLGIS
jgi:hypothetical protein